MEKPIVESVDFEYTEPVANGDFSDPNLSVQQNGTIETMPCGLVIKSIGYYGVQIDPWLPFDKERGIIRNRQYRIDDRLGFYCTAHTVAKRIIEDIEQSHLTNLHEIKSGGDGLIALAKSRQIRCISYEYWKKLDAHEINLEQSQNNAERFWYLKFWRRPKQLNGKTLVESVDFEHTESVANGDFSDPNLSVQPNGTIETIPCGLVIKSIGYYGVQIDPWLPFDTERGIIRNRQYRIDDRPGFYCTGWIGRGARGVIAETTTESHTVAKRIMEDVEQGHLTNLHDVKSGGDGLIALAKSRQIRCISYEDWKKLDAHETNLGHTKGKPREKILNIQKMLELTAS
ncbi:unnamed protein product [Rotaria sordida]|uniref:Uncharacterized protein n=1 Tax=Rotaria sordida TaxID=392033 RepID=A0A815G2Z7_9BILA|nr:unnamed protein product [Rotaria sordida]